MPCRLARKWPGVIHPWFWADVEVDGQRWMWVSRIGAIFFCFFFFFCDGGEGWLGEDLAGLNLSLVDGVVSSSPRAWLAWSWNWRSGL
jgi:hypothetical protein